MRKLILAIAIVAATAFIYREPEVSDSCLWQKYNQDRSVPDLLIAASCRSVNGASLNLLEKMRRNGV